MKLTLANILNKGKEQANVRKFSELDLPFFLYSSLVSNYGYISPKDFNEMPVPVITGLYSNLVEQAKEIEKEKDKIESKHNRLNQYGK